MLRKIRLVLWFTVAASFLVLAAFLFWPQNRNSSLNAAITGLASIGGDFELITHENKAISQNDLKGRPSLLFFGYTFCPDVCPTTLYDVSSWIDALGLEDGAIGAYFFSVDPERDTADVLSEYLSAFSDQIVGVTGDKETVYDTLKKYRVYWEKVPLEEGDYAMDHSASVYLFDSDAQFVSSISYGENQEIALNKIKNLLRR